MSRGEVGHGPDAVVANGESIDQPRERGGGGPAAGYCWKMVPETASFSRFFLSRSTNSSVSPRSSISRRVRTMIARPSRKAPLRTSCAAVRDAGSPVAPAAATKMPRGRSRLLSLSLNSASSGYPARAAQFLHYRHGPARRGTRAGQDFFGCALSRMLPDCGDSSGDRACRVTMRAAADGAGAPRHAMPSRGCGLATVREGSGKWVRVGVVHDIRQRLRLCLRPCISSIRSRARRRSPTG